VSEERGKEDRHPQGEKETERERKRGRGRRRNGDTGG